MIVADSSALCAVFFNEPEKSAFQAILDGDERCIVSAVNAHETACVLRGKLGQAAVVEFWQWLTDNRIEIVPFDAVQAYEAAAAFDRYGKGLHPEGAPEPCRLRGLRACQGHESTVAVQGR